MQLRQFVGRMPFASTKTACRFISLYGSEGPRSRYRISHHSAAVVQVGAKHACQGSLLADAKLVATDLCEFFRPAPIAAEHNYITPKFERRQQASSDRKMTLVLFSGGSRTCATTAAAIEADVDVRADCRTCCGKGWKTWSAGSDREFLSLALLLVYRRRDSRSTLRDLPSMSARSF